MKRVVLDLPVGHPQFGKDQPCACQTAGIVERQYRKLQSIDRLTPSERSIRFDNLVTTENHDILDVIRYTLATRRGIVSLFGKPGRGKTTLLIAAVNEAREANIPAVYYRVSDLLDYLRSAYDPDNRNLNIDEHWNLLTRVEVLALDELDQFKTTEWAMEKFLALIDERWRNMDRRVTLLAANTDMKRLPEKVASRLSDRRARVVHLTGLDMRQFNTWSGA